MSIYTDNGFENRTAYLRDLADNNGVPFDVVIMAAEVLGENEDFDGLVTTIQDYEAGVYGEFF